MSIVVLALAIVAAFILGLVIYISILPKHYSVTRSIKIKKSSQQIIDYLTDFNNWREWSPWLIHEKQAEVKCSKIQSKIGATYEWNGQFVGSGKIQLLTISNNQIDYQLQFFKPFKSQSTTHFKMTENENGITQIDWTMNGQLNFFTKLFRQMFVYMITNDYDIGLKFLHQKLDPQNAEILKIQFDEPSDFAQKNIISKSFLDKMEDLSKTMGKEFPKLKAFIQDKANNQEQYISLYDQFSFKKNTMKYRVAVILPEGIELNKEEIKQQGYSLEQINSCKVFKTTYTGRYDFLKLVWHSVYSHLRMKYKKRGSNQSPFELYVNDPTQILPDKTITEIYFPIKPC